MTSRDTPPAADPAMLFLASLHESVGFGHDTAGGELVVVVPGAGPQPVPGAALDRLEERGWLDLSTGHPRITEKGRYWLQKWAYKHHRNRNR